MPLSAKQRAELVRKATEKRQTTDSTKVDVVKELTSASPTFAGLTSSGAIAVDDTTNSTSTTTGSIQTDGGLGVVGKVYVGGGVDIETSSFPSFKTAATTDNTTGNATVFICKRKSSGDMADGFGSNFQFRIEDSAGSENIIGKVTATRTGGTDNRGRVRLQAGVNANTTYIDCNNNDSGVLDLPRPVTMGNDCTIGGDLTQNPSSSVTPANNGELMVEATNNTTLTFKLKGSDGVVRSGTITLS